MLLTPNLNVQAKTMHNIANPKFLSTDISRTNHCQKIRIRIKKSKQNLKSQKDYHLWWILVQKYYIVSLMIDLGSKISYCIIDDKILLKNIILYHWRYSSPVIVNEYIMFKIIMISFQTKSYHYWYFSDKNHHIVNMEQISYWLSLTFDIWHWDKKYNNEKIISGTTHITNTT